jgi:hypothetical protein
MILFLAILIGGLKEGRKHCKRIKERNVDITCKSSSLHLNTSKQKHKTVSSSSKHQV